MHAAQGRVCTAMPAHSHAARSAGATPRRHCILVYRHCAVLDCMWAGHAPRPRRHAPTHAAPVAAWRSVRGWCRRLRPPLHRPCALALKRRASRGRGHAPTQRAARMPLAREARASCTHGIAARVWRPALGELARRRSESWIGKGGDRDCIAHAPKRQRTRFARGMHVSKPQRAQGCGHTGGRIDAATRRACVPAVYAGPVRCPARRRRQVARRGRWMGWRGCAGGWWASGG